MSIQKIVLFLLFSCLSIVLFAQKNFLPGFVVHESGDTVQGMIDYRNWEKNPRKIVFKTDTMETYTVDELRSFSITGNDVYVRAIVQKDMLPVNLNFLENEGYTYSVVDTVFLRVLVAGRTLSLYELLDQKYHYYIQKFGGGYEELLYRVLRRKEDAPDYIVYNTFRDQLGFGVTDAALQKKIANASYKEEELKKIVTAINGDAVATDVINFTKQKTLAFFAGGGLTYNTMGFSGNKSVDVLQSDPYAGVELEGGMDFFTKRRLQNLFFRLALRYSNNNYNGQAEVDAYFIGQKEKRVYELKMKMLSPTFYILYTVLHTSTGKVYIGGGTALNITSYSKNIYTITNLSTNETATRNPFLEFSKNWIDLHAKLGFTFNAFELSLNRRIGGSFSGFSGYHIKNSATALVAAYRF